MRIWKLPWKRSWQSYMRLEILQKRYSSRVLSRVQNRKRVWQKAFRRVSLELCRDLVCRRICCPLRRLVRLAGIRRPARRRALEGDRPARRQDIPAGIRRPARREVPGEGRRNSARRLVRLSARHLARPAGTRRLVQGRPGILQTICSPGETGFRILSRFCS